MRKSLLDQLPLVPVPIDHNHARELGAVSMLLDQLPEAVQRVYEDLAWRNGKRVDPTQGRHGMAAEQVLRAGVLKQLNGFSYEELAFHLADSSRYQTFCRLGYNQKPLTKPTLQRNIKRVKPETWEAINQMLVHKAQELALFVGIGARNFA